MQHQTSQWKRLAQLGLLVSVMLISITALVAILDNVSKVEAQAQGDIYQASDAQVQQSAMHQWVTETVDEDGRWAPAMTLDQYQKPHLAYGCETGACYAVVSNTQWVTQTINSFGTAQGIVLDALGYPHVAFRVDFGGQPGRSVLYYAYFDGSDWIVETVDEHVGEGRGLGSNAALVLDAAGHPHITYYGPHFYAWPIEYTDFRHAYHDGTHWITETVAHRAYGYGAGFASGLVIDASGRLHTLYDGFGTVKYAYLDGNTWYTQTVASGIGGALAIAPAGSLHASFITFPSGSGDWYHLKYASLIGSEWIVQDVTRIETETVPSLLSPLGFVWPGATALQIDSLGVPHIAFFNTTDGSLAGYLRYAYRSGSDWTIETVDTEEGSGWGRLSLTLDPSNYPHIAYYAAGGDQEVRYAYVERSNVVVLLGVGATLTHTGTQSLQTVVQVPGDAVTESIELVFTERDYAPSSPAGFAFAGQGFQIEAYRSNGTHISDYDFIKPVTITIEYSEADIAVVSDENTLELHYWNGSGWDASGITIIERDVINNRLVATALHLSQFAMFGETHQIYLPLVLESEGM